MSKLNQKSRVPVLLMAEQLGSGGTERQLAETAMMLDQARFEPWVASMRPGFLQEDLRRAGVGLIELPMRSFLSADTVTQGARLWRELRQKRIQLVHTFDFPMTAFGVPVARLAGVPAVLSSQRAVCCGGPIGMWRASL
jgi:Glycosyltransferase Family 4